MLAFLRFLLLFIALLGAASQIEAQEERMEVTGTLSVKEAAPGEVFTLKLKLDVKEGFHTYPTRQKDPNAAAFVATIKVKGGDQALVERKGDVKEPETKDKLDTTLGATIGTYEHPVEMEVPLAIKAKVTAGTAKFTISFVSQVCDEMGCVPYSKSMDFEIKVKGNGAGGNEKPAGKDNGPPKENSSTTPVKSGSTSNESVKEAVKPGDQSAKSGDQAGEQPQQETLWSFTLTGIIFGFITLLTPCVFPMIPITVSFFLKQNKKGNEAIINALVYTLTIVVSLTVFAYLFVQSFQKLTQMGSTNLVLGALFIYFALSLFGAYEITLPGFLTRWTAAGEAKGGYVGTIFMAITFTIISFSCVAPFLGGFAGATAQARPVLWNIAGALGFAVAFASPFFFLAIFPSWLKALPKSGNWLNTMKVVMGFLEIAAAIKFIRTAEVLWKAGNPTLLTYDVALGLYVTICLLCGLYLIGVYQLPHDESENRKIGVGRLVWSIIFLGLGFYLLPALFRGPDGDKMRPSGIIYSWIDAFLLPSGDTKPLKLSFRGGTTETEKQKHFYFRADALTDAKTKKQRIFIDFTGVS